MHDQPTETYLDSGHPLQQRIRTIVARFAQGDGVAQGIDGCSAPNFALPLRRLAQTYARRRHRKRRSWQRFSSR